MKEPDLAFKIATWNINSARLRIQQIVKFLESERPDVLCLQEIKCREAEFPRGALNDIGYRHIAISGQKGMHGVATVSLKPFERPQSTAFCRHNEARHVATRHDGIEVHNFYVPAGGDEPDIETNPKFAHKLDFLGKMTAHFSGRGKHEDLVLVGDLNIAPHEHDVWSHKQLLKVVSHTPVETESLIDLRDAFGFVDVAREVMPEPEKLFTWWSYRSKDWKKSNRGRRLDHIWVSPSLKDRALARGRDGFRIHEECRSWTQPSDHAPVTTVLV